jgi:alpha-N-arabinofuranosidase
MRRTTQAILLFFLSLLLFFCPPLVSPLSAASITIYTDELLHPVNPLVLGNSQPHHHGNRLLDMTQPDSLTVWGFAPETEELLLGLRPTILRFPGDANEYFWEDGIGPHNLRPDSRPSQPNRNFHYGTDEHMALCEMIGAEAFICVNPVSGIADGDLSKTAPLTQKVERAANWVEYCNTPNDGTNPNGGTDWAAVRAENGHPEPYGVTYWVIGDEIHRPNRGIDVITYAQDFCAFSEAMKAVDPTIKIGASGVVIPHYVQSGDSLEWNAALVRIACAYMDFLDIHTGYPGTHAVPDDTEDIYRGCMAATQQAPVDIGELREIIDQVADSYISIVAGSNGINFEKTGKKSAASLLAGLYYADLLMMFLEDGPEWDIEFVCSWMLCSNVYHGHIGYAWGPQRRFARPMYYAQQMFRQHFGDMLVANTTNCNTFSSVRVSGVPAIPAVPELAVSTSIDTVEKKLYIMVINKQLEQDVEVAIRAVGFEPHPEANIWILNGPHIIAHNEDDHNTVTIIPSTLVSVDTSFSYTFPAHSLTAIELKRYDSPRLEDAEADPSSPLPSGYRLWQNFPNPFNGSTTIRYHLPQEERVELSIYNSLGQLVETLVDENQPPGEYEVSWDTRDGWSEGVASGVYFCCLKAGGYKEVCKMTLLR